jgi:hypothetical protein
MFSVPVNNNLYNNLERPMSVDDDFDCVKVEVRK